MSWLPSSRWLRASTCARPAVRRSNGVARGWPAWLAVLVCVATSAVAQVTPTPDHLKAVFLLNFGSFVRWPSTAFADPRAPFIIGVRGPSEFVDLLERVVAGEQIAGHPVQVHRIVTPDDAAACHIVYVVAGAEAAVPWRQLHNRPVLTVGETARFEHAGGIVRFLASENRVRLRINAKAAEHAQLVVSSQLLRLATPIDLPP